MIWGVNDDGIYKLKTGEWTSVDKISFERIFGDITDYEELKNHENSTKRWKEIFDYWKEKGILN